MQLELDLGLNQMEYNMPKIRGFEVVSKYLGEDVKMPVRATKGSAGYDIFNNDEDIVLNPGEISKAFTTKIKSYMLEDEVLKIYPRSGLGFKYSLKIVNTIPVIDSDYYNNPKTFGEIFIKFHNQGTDPLFIAKGEAYAQGIFTKYLLVDGDSFSKGAERVGGLGSTTGNV